MEFSREDIARLYGSRLFLLPDAQVERIGLSESDPMAAPNTVEPMPPPPPEKEPVGVPEPVAPQAPEPTALIEGASVSWKMKRKAELALILTDAEFQQKELTSLLKALVLEAGISTDLIGFGVAPATATSWDMRDMPVGQGIVFGPPVEMARRAWSWQNKRWQVSHRLAATTDPVIRAEVLAALKSIAP